VGLNSFNEELGEVFKLGREDLIAMLVQLLSIVCCEWAQGSVFSKVGVVGSLVNRAEGV
jgi:hypothetical protein